MDSVYALFVFKDNFSSSDYVAFDDRIASEYWFVKGGEEVVLAYFEEDRAKS
jgi:hypothetical protein